MREKIWGMLCNLKFKGYYLIFLIDKYQRRERNINIFLAITSATSVGAWIIWDKFPLLWSGIIICSQIITVIKPFFPFVKYIKELSAKAVNLELLNIEVEKLWEELQHQRITNEGASENYFDIRKKVVTLLHFTDEFIFSENKSIELKANKRMETFLKTNYGLTP